MAIHKFDKEDKKEKIRNEIRKLAKHLGKTPTMREFKRNKTDITLNRIIYFYGSWNEAIKDAGLKPTPEPNSPLFPRYRILKQELIDEFIKVANEVNGIPGKNTFAARAKFSYRPYKSNFGSWKNAIKYITDNFRDKLNFRIEEKIRPKENKEDRKVLKFLCPLQYIPQNEFETIILFSFLASKLGYLIETVRAEFPDAVLIKDGQKINCEFEYLSSNYLQHGHPQDDSCICICWRKDVEIKGIEVFSLEEYLRENNWFNK